MSHTRGFTLVEMTIVIGIVVLLAGLTLAVTVSVVQGSEIRQTEVTIQLLDAAIQEWEAQTDRQVSFGIDDEPANGSRYEVDQMLAHEDATIELLEIIRRNAAALKILSSIDPEFVKHPNPDDPADKRLVFHDAWDKPMLAVFPGRLWVNGFDPGIEPPDNDRTIRTFTESACGVAVDRRICFVSAGPDGDFGSFDQTSPDYDPEAARDNLYSYAPQTDP